jgi:hypothetical protein
LHADTDCPVGVAGCAGDDARAHGPDYPKSVAAG